MAKVLQEPLGTVFAELPPLPGKATFSLDKLIEFWEAEAERQESPFGELPARITEELAEAPELRGPLEGPAELEGHRPLLERMATAIFPAGLKILSCAGAALPGSFHFFHATARFREEILDETGKMRGLTPDDSDWASLRELYLYLYIARLYYELDFGFQKSLTMVVPDKETGLARHFQLRIQFDFAEVRLKDAPELTTATRRLLTHHPTDIAAWREFLPPEKIELYGLWVIEATDVTEELTLSRLKQGLVTTDPLMNSDNFRQQRDRLRELLRLPDLTLEVLAIQDGRAFVITPCEGQGVQEFFRDVQCAAIDDCMDAFSLDFLEEGRHLSFPDLAEADLNSPLLQSYRTRGFKSMLVAPLRLGGLLGGLFLASGHSCVLSDLAFLRIEEALPLFALALKRTTDALEHRLQALMKEKFTAIHPAVEWRFRRAAMACIQADSPTAEVGDIVFDEVYPLYGVSDIRSSSVLRNQAIQRDLTDQLELAREVILEAHRHRNLSYLASRDHRVRSFLAALEPGLHSGDEARLVDFFRSEIEPLFDSLEAFGDEVQRKVAGYRGALDPHLGLLYRQRKAFEDSMSGIRDLISRILYEEQQQAQAIFPHYFQMYKTDGVDHTIYAGASMVPDGRFDEIYLKNLRLWQLMALCRIARETRELEPRLEMPLGTAHLLLVQDVPLSIRFSQDEKQFNVDGAYNARYEIIKKRLDKADVEGTGERLTQPGKVAIVYSHDRESREYLEYVDFLVDDAVIESDVEQLELAPLQGVSGLRALRVTVR